MTKESNYSIPGATIHEDTIVPACEPWSGHVRQGDVLRLVDLEGQQAVDFLCYSCRRLDLI